MYAGKGSVMVDILKWLMSYSFQLKVMSDGFYCDCFLVFVYVWGC